MVITLLLAITLCQTSLALVQPEQVFTWNETSFSWPNDELREQALKSGDYVPANNLPLGIAVWKDKLFVTVPRWKSGVAATLNYVSLQKPINKTAALIPYPSWEANLLPKNDDKPKDDQIISTFRVSVDACDRLWVMDTGLADILGEAKQYVAPSIVIIDLKNDTVLRRYHFKMSEIKEDSFFANIVVDSLPDKCDEAFAYVPDLGGYGIVVYSFADNNSWRIKHNFFHFDPLQGDLTVGGINFQWTDGVFALALGPPDATGLRTAYFHALASTNEFSVPTSVLQNETIATDPKSYNLFKREGSKGENTQSTSSQFDQKNNVLFMTQLNKNGIACWNPKKPLQPDNFALIVQDDEKCVFVNDIKLDTERNLWILSDKLPAFIYRQLNPEEINYRIMKINVDKAIAGTACES